MAAKCMLMILSRDRMCRPVNSARGELATRRRSRRSERWWEVGAILRMRPWVSSGGLMDLSVDRWVKEMGIESVVA